MTKKPLLAADFDPSKHRFPSYGSPKIDGLRCRVIGLVGYSRSMKMLPNLHLQGLIAALPERANNLDGELTVGLPHSATAFQDSTGPIRRVSGEPDIVFNVFDDFSEPDRPFKERAAKARATVAALRTAGFTWIRFVQHVVVRSLEDLEAMEEQYLSMGYEGLMLRDPNGKYKSGRSTANEQILCKVKRYVDFEVIVTGFEEEMQNNNEARENEVGRMKRSNHSENMVPKGTLGAVQGKMLNGPFKGVEVSCGSGFSAEERLEIWSNKSSYIGKAFTVKYFPIGCKDKPRHPVFKGWRPDWDFS